MIGYYISFGLISGAIYAVAAVGLSLLLRTTGFRFLAFGDTMTAGAFIAYVFNAQMGLNVYLSMGLAAVATGFIGILLYWIVFKGFKGARMATMLILTVALAFIIRNFLLLIWGPYPVRLKYATVASFNVGPLFFNWPQIIIILISLFVMIAFYIIMTFTRVGKGIRAVGDDPDLAQIRGISNRKVMTWAWFICIGLAGLSGTMLGMMGAVNPAMGFQILLLAFSAMILGGIGNPYGAAIGGFIIGLFSELTAAVGLAEYKIAAAYLLMAIVLLVRPKGLFPAK